MQPFTFRLERVRNLREHNEETARHEWANAKARWQEEQRIADALRQKRTEAADFGYQQKEPALRCAMYQYLNSLEQHLDAQLARVAEAAAAEDRCRRLWVKAKQDREALDNLREKAYQNFVRDQLRQEQYVLDDMAKKVQSI